MSEFIKAWGRGLLAVYLVVSMYAGAGLLFWAVGSGEITGWLALVAAPVGFLALLGGIGLTALFGHDLRDSDEKYES